MDIELILNHLVRYKNEVLGVEENGFKNGKYNSLMLPKELATLNILQSGYFRDIVNAVIREDKGKNKKDAFLKQDYASLNSSKIFGYNFFYPLLFGSLMPKFLKIATGVNDEERVHSYEFNKMHDAKEGTRFSLYLRTNLYPYHFDIKYTNTDFGRIELEDLEEQGNYEIYLSLLHLFEGVDLETFCNHYQVFRHLMYNNGGYNIFAFPSYATNLQEELDHVLYTYCSADLINRVKVVHIDEMASRFAENSNEKFSNHYKMFLEKYFPFS